MTPALERWRSWSDPVILLLSLFSIPVILLEFAWDQLPNSDRMLLTIANVVILVGFGTDYLAGLVKSSKRWGYVRNEWLMGALVVVSLVTVLPLGAGAIGAIRVLRLVRLARPIAGFIRLLSVGAEGRRRALTLMRRRSFRTAMAAAALTWITSAAAFTLAEGVGSQGRNESFGDALWWSAATITTVGYGDIAPQTGVGRSIALFTMIVGISVLSVVTAGIAAFFVSVDHEPDNDVAID